MDICIHTAESLCCLPATITTVLSLAIPQEKIKNYNKNLKKLKCHPCPSVFYRIFLNSCKKFRCDFSLEFKLFLSYELKIYSK